MIMDKPVLCNLKEVYRHWLNLYGDIGSGNPPMYMIVIVLSIPILRKRCMRFIDCQMVVTMESQDQNTLTPGDVADRTRWDKVKTKMMMSENQLSQSQTHVTAFRGTED
jgi:hypothetical protein